MLKLILSSFMTVDYFVFLVVFGLQEGLQVMLLLTLMIEEMLKMLFVK